jgi:hypothetical protein
MLAHCADIFHMVVSYIHSEIGETRSAMVTMESKFNIPTLVSVAICF